MNESNSATNSTRLRRWLWPVVKWALFALVMAFVVRQGWTLWQTTPRGQLHVDWRWLVPATLAYLAAWVPSVWFWRTLLKGHGPTPAWPAALRAYYLGHLGKYVPGKAMVLVIRAALLRDAGCAIGVSAATAMYETLAMMGGGAVIAVALSPWATSPALWALLPARLQPLQRQMFWTPVLVGVATLLCLPMIARLFAWMIRISAPRGANEPQSSQAAAVPTSQFARRREEVRPLVRGMTVMTLGWFLLALSLGCVLRSVGVTVEMASGFPVWLAAVTLSNVVGNAIVIAPAGLGVRELLLTDVLQTQPGIGEAQAFLAAWLMRTVSLLGELLAAGVLWWLPARGSTFRRDPEGSAPLEESAPLPVAVKPE
jgi:hypothetical protein